MTEHDPPVEADAGEERAVLEMLERVRAPERWISVTLAWAAFVFTTVTSLGTLWYWIALALAAQKTLGSSAESLFSFWGPPILIGSLVTAIAALVMAIFVCFKPLCYRLPALALSLGAFWLLAMHLLRVAMFSVGR